MKLADVRRLALALPEATESPHFDRTSFRVRDKMFAMYSNNHHGDGRIAVVVKAVKEFQEVLVSADPKRFYVPPYVGHKGWVGVRLDVAVDWAELADILRDAYLMIAPPKLAAQLGSAGKSLAA